MIRLSVGLPALFAVVVTAACGGDNTPLPRSEPVPGADRTAKTGALETGANLVQAKAPVEKIAMYLNGFHVSQDDPKMQMEAHHYCNQANEDLAQCLLFDGNTADARMIGIEYVISEKLYNTLPAGEKALLASAQRRDSVWATPNAPVFLTSLKKRHSKER
jgi:Protein of unknown function (DUF1264)